MTTVYAVARGEYSDYRIVAIYSTRALAEAVVAEINGSDNAYDKADIEVFALDEAKSEIEQGYHHYFVRLSEGGDFQECRRDPPSGFIDTLVGRDIHKGYYTHCWAEHDEHAIKIAKDRRAQAVALNQ
jgi:hypothetical protein